MSKRRRSARLKAKNENCNDDWDDLPSIQPSKRRRLDPLFEESDSSNDESDKENISPINTRKRDKRSIKKQRALKASKAAVKVNSKKYLPQHKLVAVRQQFQNARGRSRTLPEVKLLLQSIAWQLSTHDISERAAINMVAEAHGSSIKYLDKIWNHYKLTSTAEGVDMRSERECVIDNIYDLNEDSGGKVFELIVTFAFNKLIATKEGYHAFDLQVMLKQNGYIVSLSAIRDILRELDFKWSDKDVYYGQNMKDTVIIEQKKKLFLAVSQVLQRQRDKKDVEFHVMDESWANEGTNMNYSPIHKCRDCPNCFVVKSFKELAGINQKLITKINKRGVGKRKLFLAWIGERGILNGLKSDLDQKYLKYVNNNDDDIYMYRELVPVSVRI